MRLQNPELLGQFSVRGGELLQTGFRFWQILYNKFWCAQQEIVSPQLLDFWRPIPPRNFLKAVNGFFVKPMANNFSGISGYNGIRGYILCDDSVRRNNTAVVKGHSSHNGCTMANPDIVLEDN